MREWRGQNLAQQARLIPLQQHLLGNPLPERRCALVRFLERFLDAFPGHGGIWLRFRYRRLPSRRGCGPESWRGILLRIVARHPREVECHVRASNPGRERRVVTRVEKALSGRATVREAMQDSPVATNLASLRTARNLSQGELAERAGLAAQTYRAIESGSVSPRSSTLLSLAKALGVRLDELLGELPGSSEMSLRGDDQLATTSEKAAQAARRLRDCAELEALLAERRPKASMLKATEEDRLGRLVRRAYEEELISLSRCAEILRVSSREMRQIARGWPAY